MSSFRNVHSAQSDIQKPLPEVLYKYRDWGKQFNRTVLTDCEIYFSSPADFNDPFDSKIRVRYDKVPDGELLRMMYERFLRGNPNAGHAAGVAAANRALSKIRDVSELERIHTGEYEANAGFAGIFSMTLERDNVLMWSHYAQSHSGFVVGLDAELLNEDIPCVITRVVYQEEYPIVLPASNAADQIMDLVNVLNTKAALWAYEQEIRLIKGGGAMQTYPFRPEVVREVILGCKMSPQHRSEILAITNQLPAVSVFEARVNNEAFALDIVPL
jgi:hypothetical protein